MYIFSFKYRREMKFSRIAQFGAGLTHLVSDGDIFKLSYWIFIREMCGFLQYSYNINLSFEGSDGFVIKVQKIISLLLLFLLCIPLYLESH